MADEDADVKIDEGDDLGPPAGVTEYSHWSGRQIVSSSNTNTEERQLAVTKIPGGDSPFEPNENKDVYKRMMDCAQFSLASISATVRDNSITVTGQLEENGNISSETMTVARDILEKYDMEKVEAWLSEDKTLFISFPKKHGPVVDK